MHGCVWNFSDAPDVFALKDNYLHGKLLGSAAPRPESEMATEKIQSRVWAQDPFSHAQ